MIDAHVGIDIAKHKFDVACLALDSPIKYRSFPNNPDGFENMILWLEGELFCFEPHFCMEATGRYGEQLAFFLNDSGFKISLMNPTCIKNYARSKLRRTKTDKIDSAIIAEYCLKETPAAWKPLAKDSRDLQQLSRELDHLKSILADEKSRAKAGTYIPAVKESIDSRLNFFEAQVKLLEGEINSIIEMNQRLKNQKKLLLTIPGIGDTTANGFLAEIPDIARFKSAKQLVAFAGLVPRESTSGTLHNKPRLSKVGSSRIRKLLYMPTVSAKRYNPAIIALCSRIEDKGKSKMVAIGAAMRKLLHIAYGVLKSGRPFNKRLHVLKA